MSLALAIAPASVEKGLIIMTGPEISEFVMGEDEGTEVEIMGWMWWGEVFPFLCSAPVGDG